MYKFLVICNYDIGVHKSIVNKYGYDHITQSDNANYGYNKNSTILDQIEYKDKPYLILLNDAVSVNKFIAKRGIEDIKLCNFDDSCDLVELEFNDDYAIESILYHAYGIVTTQNSFLSRYTVGNLDKFDLKKVDKKSTIDEFKRIQSMSWCPKQVSLLQAICDQYVTFSD